VEVFVPELADYVIQSSRHLHPLFHLFPPGGHGTAKHHAMAIIELIA
jgi:hypothetical protein